MRTMKALQEFEDHFASPEVQVPRRFIGEQDGRRCNQRAGQHNALLFASRQFTGAVRLPRVKTDFIQPR